MREVRGHLQAGNYEVGRVLARELATWFQGHAATMDAMLAHVLRRTRCALQWTWSEAASRLRRT
jgi:hemerythrin